MSTNVKNKKKELGVFMLILAAETVAECCISEEDCLSTELVACSPLVAVQNRTMCPPPAADLTNCADPLFEIEESSAGDSDSTKSPACELTESACLAHHRVVVGCVLSYLPWQDVLRHRQVSRLWFEQSLNYAAVYRMPSSGMPAIFVSCADDLDAAAEAEELRLSVRHSHREPVDISKCSRIFLGQLRREGTVASVGWYCRSVLQCDDQLVGIENHYHKVTGRGKGCCWAFLESGDAAAKMLEYHRRCFWDVINGVEGVWIAHPLATQGMADEVSLRSYDNSRPRYLPRQAIVAELPMAQPPVIKPAEAPRARLREARFPSLSVAPPPYSVATSRPSGAPCRDVYHRPAWRHDPYAVNVLYPSH